MEQVNSLLEEVRYRAKPIEEAVNQLCLLFSVIPDSLLIEELAEVLLTFRTKSYVTKAECKAILDKKLSKRFGSDSSLLFPSSFINPAITLSIPDLKKCIEDLKTLALLEDTADFTLVQKPDLPCGDRLFALGMANKPYKMLIKFPLKDLLQSDVTSELYHGLVCIIQSIELSKPCDWLYNPIHFKIHYTSDPLRLPKYKIFSFSDGHTLP